MPSSAVGTQARSLTSTVWGSPSTIAQAYAIVENTPMGAEPSAGVGVGLYIALAASAVLVAFGLTIVVKRATQPYLVASADDDVE